MNGALYELKLRSSSYCYSAPPNLLPGKVDWVDTAVFPRMRDSAKPGNPSKSSIRQIKLYSVAVKKSMRFDVITLFPDFFTSPLQSGLLGKALAKGIAQVVLTNPRDFAPDKHRRVDDEPYGGGVGMLMKPDPIFAAVESVPVCSGQRQVIFMTPQGEPMQQGMFQDLATRGQLVILCGNYEGVDERVLYLVDREVSLGDFVLTGGEIPALALINGVTRLLPGTVGKEASLKAESFEAGLLDYPQYTRPPVFREWAVPSVLLSGNHAAIAHWREAQQIQRTRDRRPDLYVRWLQTQSGQESLDSDPRSK